MEKVDLKFDVMPFDLFAILFFDVETRAFLIIFCMISITCYLIFMEVCDL